MGTGASCRGCGMAVAGGASRAAGFASSTKGQCLVSPGPSSALWGLREGCPGQGAAVRGCLVSLQLRTCVSVKSRVWPFGSGSGSAPPPAPSAHPKAPGSSRPFCNISAVTKPVVTVLLLSPAGAEGRIYPLHCCCFPGLCPQAATPAGFRFHEASCLLL